MVHLPNQHPPAAAGEISSFDRTHTTIDVGWDHEVWPEFTRSQIHLLYDVGFTENPERESKFHISPMEVSYVSLTNRSELFESWLDDG